MRAWNLFAALLLISSVASPEAIPPLGTVLASDVAIVEEDDSPLAPVLPPAGQDLDGSWHPLGSGVIGPFVSAVAVS